MIPESNFTTLSLPAPLIGTYAVMGVISTATSCAYIGFAEARWKSQTCPRGREAAQGGECHLTRMLCPASVCRLLSAAASSQTMAGTATTRHPFSFEADWLKPAQMLKIVCTTSQREEPSMLVMRQGSGYL